MNPGYIKNTGLGLCQRGVKAQCEPGVTENCKSSPGRVREVAAALALL